MLTITIRVPLGVEQPANLEYDIRICKRDRVPFIPLDPKHEYCSKRCKNAEKNERKKLSKAAGV